MFTDRQGPSRRGLASWMARATSSLPVPVSPRSSTGTSRSATRRISWRTRRIPSLSPIRPKLSANAGAAGAAAVCSSRTTRSASSRTTPRSTSSRGEGARPLPDRHAVRHQPGAAPSGGDGDRARSRSRVIRKRRAADAAVQQRPGVALVGSLEAGLETGEESVRPASQPAEDRPLADPPEIGVIEDRQRGMADRARLRRSPAERSSQTRLLDRESGRGIGHLDQV